MSIFEPDPFDFFGQAISLQLAIREFRKELTIDICESSPRLVVMAVADLERRADEIVASMQSKMEQKHRRDLDARTGEID